jgi:hypothetical protein
MPAKKQPATPKKKPGKQYNEITPFPFEWEQITKNVSRKVPLWEKHAEYQRDISGMEAAEVRDLLLIGRLDIRPLTQAQKTKRLQKVDLIVLDIIARKYKFRGRAPPEEVLRLKALVDSRSAQLDYLSEREGLGGLRGIFRHVRDRDLVQKKYALSHAAGGRRNAQRIIEEFDAFRKQLILKAYDMVAIKH